MPVGGSGSRDNCNGSQLVDVTTGLSVELVSSSCPFHLLFPPSLSQILAVFLIGLLIPLATLHYQATAAVGVGLAAVLLLAVAVVGIVAAMTHHQVVLFCVSLNRREESGVCGHGGVRPF